MVSVNHIILKNCFNFYGDQSLYNNYCKIENQYYKLYKEYKDKKYSSNNQDKLKEDVKKWLFNQSLESRMKICTVENELFGKILFQMFYYYKTDRSMLFKPKPIFFSDDECQFEKKTDILNYNGKNENEMICPSNNTNIKVTRTNKSGKKMEAPILGFSQSSLKDFKDEEIRDINFGNYFSFQSYRGNFSLSSFNNCSNNNEEQKKNDLIIEDFFENIIFFSVHHKYYPDCFTLSPEFLLEKSKFENIFNRLGNNKCFCTLIHSQIIPSNNKNQKQYYLPDWFKNNNEDKENYHSATQYAIMFFEQVIMIKYLLNKNEKKIKTYSLLNEQALNVFFSDRKEAINYMKNNYNKENKINILKDLEIEKYYNNVVSNNEKMKYVDYFKKILKQVYYNDKFKNNPHTVESILNNPYHNKYEERYNKKKGIEKPKNNNKNVYNIGELTLDEIINKITNILNNSDNICFIDYLLFQNYICLWKIEYFLVYELFEKLSNLIKDRNTEELILYCSKPSKNKTKHRKKNKKNKNTIQVQKEEEKPTNNIIQNEYDGIFKDEEEELYAPYYLRANTEQKKLFLKLKGNLNNNVLSEEQIIKDYIYNDIILGVIIDNVFLTPLNSGLDFSDELKKDYSNTIIKDDENIINGIMQKEEKQINEEKEDSIKKENENISNKKKEELIKNNNTKREEIKTLNDINEEVTKVLNDIKEEENKSLNDIKDNNLNKINIDITNTNNLEVSNNIIQKENDLDINDSLSLKSDIFSSEIDKTTITSTTTINTNNDNNTNNKDFNNNDLNKKNDLNNSNNNNNVQNTKQKKKKEKEQTFFLFDTVKKKKKKNIQNTHNNALISNEFNIITIKDSNGHLDFLDKLHNDIIKHETKVITLLNHGMKFKDYCIKEIKRIIQETFNSSNDYNIDVYGSYATGLMIEASDIDIKIKLNCGDKEKLNNFFQTLCERLENENKFDTINPIGTASVPVIKLLLSLEKFIKGNEDLENSFKQYKELSLFKHYLFDVNELTKIKIDVTFIMTSNNKNKTNNNSIINDIKEKIIENNNHTNINNNIINNNETAHDHDKSMDGEMSSVAYVKEQIVKYPEIKFILRVLKRYFYYKKMNTSFLGGLSSYNLFLLLLSYAKFLRKTPNPDLESIGENNDKNNTIKMNLGYFLFYFLYFIKMLDFKQCVIDINSPNIYNMYNLLIPEKAKEYNFGKSIVIIDPLTGVNASKSSYKVDEIYETFSEAYDFFQSEKIKYEKEGKTKVNKNNNKDVVMGLPISNKNDNYHGGGNIIEKFLGK